MKVNEFKFDEFFSFHPEEGQVVFNDQRVIIMSADSFGDYIKEFVQIGGVNLCRIFMRRLGEHNGRSDAKLIKQKMNPDTDIDWLALGPTIHTWEGIVKAVPEVIDFDRASKKFYMKGTWENSFWAEQYVKNFGISKESVCWLLTGYATGYASEFFGEKLIAKEPTCRGKGDDICRFEIKPESDWEAA